MRICNGKVTFSRSDFISPTDPVLRLELAIDCDGGECGIGVHDENGKMIDLEPHYHLVESQQGAWTRRFAIGGALPVGISDASH
jgi:hypothetical protein